MAHVLLYALFAGDVRAYVGGLQVCKHKWSLLDEAQGQPWPDQPLEYYQKYRFYFQEYKPEHHVVALPRAVWAIGAFIGVSVGPSPPHSRRPIHTWFLLVH